MRDAGVEGREERRARRDRDLARRSGDLSEEFFRLAGAIVADAGAFMLWNLASRSPARLIRDLADGISQPALAARGVTRFVAGLALLVAGAVLVLPLAIQTSTFAVLETWTMLTGLLVEQLVGTDLRRR